MYPAARVKHCRLIRGLWILALTGLITATAASASLAAGRDAKHGSWRAVPRHRAHWTLPRIPSPLAPAARGLWRARSSLRPRIVGGTGASQGQFGFMAFIADFDSSGNPQFACSGTLVASNVVLTAGHCAVDETTGVPLAAGGYRVVTGAADWTDTTNRQISTVSQVIVDPQFDPSGPIHDAALLVLSAPITETPIALWSSGSLSAGTGAVMAGWGLTSGTGTGQDTTLLQSAPTVLQSVSYCSQPFYANYVYDSASELCTVNAPTYDTGTCSGDSGGPLLVQSSSGQTVEIGLTSVGAANCDTQAPDYFTAARPLASWVASEASAVAPSGSSSPGSGGPSTSPGSTAPGTSTAPPAGSGSPTTPTPATTSSQLPTLSLAAARTYARQTLTHALRSKFISRRALKLSCVSVTSARASCGFSFRSGPSYYSGTVIVSYYLGSGNKPAWAGTYNLRWVNNHCYFHTTHPASCAVHRRNGSW